MKVNNVSLGTANNDIKVRAVTELMRHDPAEPLKISSKPSAYY